MSTTETIPTILTRHRTRWCRSCGWSEENMDICVHCGAGVGVDGPVWQADHTRGLPVYRAEWSGRRCEIKSVFGGGFTWVIKGGEYARAGATTHLEDAVNRAEEAMGATGRYV